MGGATSFPPPLAGEGKGGGTQYDRAFPSTPSPPLPRKRGEGVDRVCGASCRSPAGAAEAARAARRVARQRQKAVQLGEQQRADVKLGEEDAALDQARDLGGRNEFHADARLRLERGHARAGLDEEIVDAVVEAPGAGGVLAERVNEIGRAHV